MRESSDDPRDSERHEAPDSSTAAEAPPTEPGSALAPPPKQPLTAIGEAWRQPDWRGRNRFERLANDILDAIDGFADRIASELGLR